jgi:hypothetical protein
MEDRVPRPATRDRGDSTRWAASSFVDRVLNLSDI